MANIAHLEPIAKKMTFYRKMAYAKSLSSTKINQMRVKTSAKYSTTGSLVLVNIFQFLIIASIISSILYFFVFSGNVGMGNTSIQNSSSNGQQSSSGSNNPSSGSGSSGNPITNSDAPADSLVKRTIDAVLRLKGVSDFSQIKDSNDPLLKTKLFVESATGKVTIRLTCSYIEVTRSQLRDAVRMIMSGIQDQVTDLQSIIMVTNDNYFVEVANRTK